MWYNHTAMAEMVVGECEWGDRMNSIDGEKI